MSNLLVGYDLNSPGKDYRPLIEKLKSSYSNWWHCLDSTWIIVTNKTPVQVRDELAGLMDSNDELLVIDTNGGSAAWRGFDSNCSTWLKSNL